MSAIDLLLSRLENPRPTGRDRWRCACPVCGGKNRSTLSFGVGDTGAILLKCFKNGCSVDEIARAIRITTEELFPPREGHGRPMRRRRLVSPTQAIDALEVEIQLVWTAAHNLAFGHALKPEDLGCLSVAANRIRARFYEARS